MCGGNIRESQQRVARSVAGLLIAVPLVVIGQLVNFCQAGEGSAELSILVPVEVAKSENTTEEPAEDLLDVAIPESVYNALAPIANVSEYEPDLADPIALNAAPDSAELVEIALPSAEDFTEVSDQPSALLKSEVIGFHGVTPGLSHRRDVFRAWGDPRTEDTTSAKLDYRFDKLKSVQVSFDGNIVDTIVVQMQSPVASEVLIRRLHLEAVRPAPVSDQSGEIRAQVFPERGVILRFAEDSTMAIASDSKETGPLVSEIVIQPIKASPFVLRAEHTRSTHLSHTIADLEESLQFDHNSPRARSILSSVLLEIGQAVAAERYAAEAVEIDSRDDHYRLQWAKCLRELARYDRAVEQTRAVLESPTGDSLVRAQALYEMGLLAGLGSAEVVERAVPFLSKAINIADRLTIEEDLVVRREAKQLLVDVHLAMAVEISRGKWQEKEETVPLWIARASALAEGLIDEDESNLSLRLEVAVSALAAAASLENTIDPLLWVEEAEETVVRLHDATVDPLTRAQHDWSLGLAYFHGAQIEHRRSAPESAERLGSLAETKLATLAKDRDEMPDTAYLLGRLYFQLGAVQAVHEDNHVAACRWYDQAAELLLNPVPVTTVASPQQHGDALVSMGVSYWHNDQRRRAIEITQSGVDLIEQAVDGGLLDSESLLVPYGNLAAMYEALGESESAAKYTRLAKQLSIRR